MAMQDPNQKPPDDDGGDGYSDEELTILRTTAAGYVPLIEWPANAHELRHAYQTNIWLEQIGKDSEKVAPGEHYAFDPRSLTELYKRFGPKPDHPDQRTVVDQIGGRRIDGWINPPRSELPENDQDLWPRDKVGKPQDPWGEEVRVTLRRTSDEQLLVWTTRYDRKAIGEALDLFYRECRQHPGRVPTFTLSGVLSGKNYKPLLVPTGNWVPFGEGASPPANPARLQRARDELKRIREKYEPKIIPLTSAKAAKGKAAPKRDAMEDEIPF